MGQLEKYGLYVLVVVIVLILGVAIWGGEPPVSRGDLAALPSNQSLDTQQDPRRHERIRLDDPYVDVPQASDRGGSDEPGIEPGPRDRPAPSPRFDTDPDPFVDPEVILDGPADGPVNVDPQNGDPAPPAPRQVEHVLARGEFLGDVSKRYFGTTSRWKEIADWNGITDPTSVPEGRRLLIRLDGNSMSGGNGGRQTQAGGEDRPRGERSYTVRRGDSLSKIAQRELGSQRYVPDLKEANGLESDLIDIGQILIIPDLPAGSRE